MRSIVGGMAVTVCLTLGACGSAADSDRPQDPSPGTGTSTEAPADPDPTLTAKPPAASQQLDGRIESGVETRCLVLTVEGGQSYVLTGSVAGLEPGDRVTVKGRSDPGAATTCQQGPVFVVAEIVAG